MERFATKVFAIAVSGSGTEQGTFRAILQDLAEDLYERGKIDIQEAFIDGSFAPAKKGGAFW